MRLGINGLIGLMMSLAAQMALAQNAQLHVYCSNGIRAAIEELKSDAEREIGRELLIEFSASTMLQSRIEAGESFDLAILTPSAIDDLARSGKLAADSIIDIASSDLGVGIRAGSEKADIGTAEGMRQRLLRARSVTWTDGGAAGPSVLEMFEGLGISEQMKPKIVLQTVPGRPAISVAEGENELMFAPVSEIATVAGVEVLGRFPKEFQKPVAMTAGIAAEATDSEGARKLIAFLTSAKATGAMLGTGMNPAATE